MPLERHTQDRIIELLTQKMMPGYTNLGNLQYETDNDFIIEARLLAYLTGRGVAPELAQRAINRLRTVATEAGKDLKDRNEAVYNLLKYGVSIKPAPGQPNETIQFIDWEAISNNDFAVAEEVTYRGEKEKRPDVVIYINGISLVVLELKRASGEVGDGIRQSIRNQEDRFIGDFFSTVQLVLAGNDSQGLRYGTVGTTNKWFLEWKEEDDDTTQGLKIDRDLRHMLDRFRLMELIRDFVLFDGGIKKLPRPHQYFAVKNAQRHLRPRPQERNGGIIWHTQGSGKSLTMVMLARWLLRFNPEARVIMLTDRRELDKQIHDVFDATGETIARATSSRELMDLLTATQPRLVCSLVHKFGKRDSAQDFEDYLTELRARPRQPYGELFVFVDECHRTQSGKLHRAVKAMLPQATFIGFTGTPLLANDKETSQEVFGSYIHTYKFNEAVRDGIVMDLAYEARDVDQRLGSPERIDAWFADTTQGLNDYQRGELKKLWATKRRVLSSKGRITRIAEDIAWDFRRFDRLKSGKGNAILVAGGIYEACRYYEVLNARGSVLRGHCAVVTSYNPQTRDIVHEATGEALETEKEFIYETYQEILKDVAPETGKTPAEVFEDRVKTQFVKSPARMKLLIVVDKLLTGFDAPACTYLYIDKKMQDHGLFQAITRVNRLDEGKIYGHIIDYKGLFEKVAGAISVYTSELDAEGFDQEDIDVKLKTRYELGREKLEEARRMVNLLAEPVAPPHGTEEYIHYFVGDSTDKTTMGANKTRRDAFYRAFASFARAYATLSDAMLAAGYTDDETKAIKVEVKHYEEMRQIIRHAAGETLDRKAYEADMRYLIDTYIDADASVKLHDFGDQTLLDLIEAEGAEDALSHLPAGIRQSPAAMAETITNNVRRKIITDHHLDPTFFDDISALLDAILEERRQGVIDYAEAIGRLAELAKKTNQGNREDVPEGLQAPEQRALFGLLNRDKDLTIRIDATARAAARADWRGNPVKEKELQKALFGVLGDVNETLRVFSFLEGRKEY
ncbi:HsdR family type I site-specific deoxyribonuclease [Neolewinella aurantiaca]|uniref:Type I restriction enzyme endonuclease subunit n=1 Tax=Neolewinella aurantiaca TaxID=2602767 RepID=A0A5C7FNY1_9BACT|nr:HsdR family type I site-specific deoxyribonuclease [Neolewinella aurantiaca]TXF89330.1 HsdR family type I site-specific deoxyribonuclease [Neolewinella aurantiaca]